MKSLKLWFQRFVLGFLGLFILFLLFTFTYARIKDGWVLSHPPENSLFINIGQRKLYIRAMGLEHEGPAIVLLPGFLGNSSAWAIVQPELAKTHRVYAFDLAGFGWSDPAPMPLTPSRIADDKNLVGEIVGYADDVYCDNLQRIVEGMYDAYIKEYQEGFIRI